MNVDFDTGGLKLFLIGFFIMGGGATLMFLGLEKIGWGIGILGFFVVGSGMLRHWEIMIEKHKRDKHKETEKENSST